MIDDEPSSSATRTRRGRRSRPDSDGERTAPLKPAHGGRFEPLSATDLARIHAAALEILATIGMAEAPEPVVAIVEAGGGRRLADGRLAFPPPLVERALAGLGRHVTLCGQSAAHDLHLEGTRVHLGTGGAAPFVVDLETGAYRPSTLRDLYDAARLVDRLEHVHFFSRSLVARDMPDERALDVNTAFASLAGTTKHVCVSATNAATIEAIAALCFAIAGSAEAFRARPFLSVNINHVVPPLRFAGDACGVLMTAARLGVPVHVNTFGQLGASSPVTIAGSVAQSIAETLAGMIVAWLIDPQVKAVFGPRPMMTDLRTGAMSGGGGEQALLTAASVQMARHYGLPNSTIAGASDSKIADAQSGYEKCLNVTLAAQTGANMVTQACGMQASLMGCSFESYVVDNDMLGAILRTLAPIEVGDATLSAAEIGEVVRGEGHFLGQPQTLARMQTDFLYPRIADRRSPAEWEAAGAEDIRRVANRRAREILATHVPRHLDPALVAELRRRFDLRLATA
ncbi:MAG: trimethylamine methyltransferase [Alphaproteobacteria bacterium]|nr:trimethylamine methyltransferase [Alphaproteobacteria bacterium]